MKRPIFVLIVIFIFLAGLPLFAAGDAAAGKEAYTKKCASCHGPDGVGKDQIAQMMKIKFTPLGAKEVQAKSDADLKKIAARRRRQDESRSKMSTIRWLRTSSLSFGPLRKNETAFVSELFFGRFCWRDAVGNHLPGHSVPDTTDCF